jgi:hypothetical protein
LNNLAKGFIVFLIIHSFLLAAPREAHASPYAHAHEDTLAVYDPNPGRQEYLFNPDQERQESLFNPDPVRAAMFSAVLPGMGQIYNRKYWKVPIVYAGFAGLTWYTMFAHEQFVRYRTALDFRMDGNPETIDEFAGDFRYTQDVLTRFRDYYRRQRDRTVIWTALFYAITIIDATVDAHLFEFDVSDDLGMQIGPSFQGADYSLSGKNGQFGMGIRFRINF